MTRYRGQVSVEQALALVILVILIVWLLTRLFDDPDAAANAAAAWVAGGYGWEV